MIRVSGRAAAAGVAPRLPRAQQAARRGLDDVGPRGPPYPHRRARRGGPELGRLFHVGRLDTDTSGLLLLTNDGDFAQRMAHPSYEVDKTYVAEVSGEVTQADARSGCATGVTLDDGPVEVRAVKRRSRPAQARRIVELVIHEGRNRIVRRLLDHVGHPVVPAHPHRHRPGRRSASSATARCARSPTTSSAPCSTAPSCECTLGRGASLALPPCQCGPCEAPPSSRPTTGSTCSTGSPRWCSTSWPSNGLTVDDFISVIFTATSDLLSEFPAYAARQLGFGDVPLLCARELEIAGSMPRVVRMMAHVETDLPRAEITHCYLHGAAALRKDLTRTREVPDGRARRPEPR